jgi:hypothetical protein
MKREIAEYVAVCDSCQRIKAEHQRPVGLLQPLQIPQWKWDEIGMDFIVRLPRTRTGYDSIWVVVDRLTKVAHFIPVKTTYNSARDGSRTRGYGYPQVSYPVDMDMDRKTHPRVLSGRIPKIHRVGYG